MIGSQAARELWYRGDLRYLCRPGAQSTLYNTVEAWKDEDGEALTIGNANCHRRKGKSYWGLVKCIERCLKSPWTQAKFGAPTDEQVLQIVLPNLALILAHCPPELQPEKTKEGWKFRNPRWGVRSAYSTLSIVGVNYKRGDRLRGQAADIVVLDEVRDMEDLEYVVTDVLMWQFVGRRRPLLMMLSTPPDSMDHPWVSEYIPMSRRQNRYLEITIEDNPDWNKEDDEWLVKFCGGRDTVAFRREAMCELVSDWEKLIVPEWVKQRESLFIVWIRPSHFIPVCGMDTGWEDFTALEYGYVDFESQRLIYEHEIFVHYKSTGELAEMVREYEHQHYRGQKVRRYADMTLQQLNDFKKDQKLHFRAADKYDAEGAISRFRTAVQCNKVVVTPGCPELDYQLKNGVRDDKRRIRRTKRMGHCDALKAAVYLYRMINFHENPFPASVPNVDMQFSPHRWNEHGEHPNRRALLQALGRTRLN